MIHNFEKWKDSTLKKADLSSKGSIDEKIAELCNKINKSNNFFTTSSCSGRICLLEVKGRHNKKNSNWLHITHKKGNFKEIEEIFLQLDGEGYVELRQESAIIHICCKDLELANKVIKTLKESGFNRSHIISTRKIIVESICEQPVSIPIYDDKKLINEDYLMYLTKKLNVKQEYSWKCIDKLTKKFNL